MSPPAALALFKEIIREPASLARGAAECSSDLSSQASAAVLSACARAVWSGNADTSARLTARSALAREHLVVSRGDVFIRCPPGFRVDFERFSRDATRSELRACVPSPEASPAKERRRMKNRQVKLECSLRLWSPFRRTIALTGLQINDKMVTGPDEALCELKEFRSPVFLENLSTFLVRRHLLENSRRSSVQKRSRHLESMIFVCFYGR